SFDYHPAADYFGDDQFSYRVYDGHGGYSNSATVRIVIDPVDDRPRAVDDYLETNEDVPLTIKPIDLLRNDWDEIPSLLWVRSVVSLPSHGTLVRGSDGNYTYTPEANWYGTDQFTYLPADQYFVSERFATVTIRVNSVNDAPWFTKGAD